MRRRIRRERLLHERRHRLHLTQRQLGVDLREGLKQEYPASPTWSKASGRAILSREVVQIADILADAGYETTAAARTFGARSILAVPMLREGSPIGAILIYRREPALFPEKQVALLQTFADQAVIAVENARLFKALEARNAEPPRRFDQQTATSEILRVISRSPTDVQPVFDAIVDNAVRLCDGMFAASCSVTTGSFLHFVAEHRCSGEAIEPPPKPVPDAAARLQCARDRRPGGDPLAGCPGDTRVGETWSLSGSWDIAATSACRC